MEEPTGATSGSMAINLPLHSHLGPINCCPCHLRATPAPSIPLLRRRQVSTTRDASARSRQHSRLRDKGRLNREQLTAWITPSVCARLGHQGSRLPFPTRGYTEAPQRLTEIGAGMVHLLQFQTLYFSERLPWRHGFLHHTLYGC